MNAETTYEWRMRANDTESVLDVGPWSEERTFSTPASKPIAILSPADGATVASETTEFRWTPMSDAPVGWVEFSRTPDFADPVREVETAENVVTPRRLEPGLWYWRVNAGRGTWLTASSPVRTVHVLDTIPPAAIGIADRTSTYGPISLYGSAQDGLGDVAKVAASPDGVTWTEFPFSGDVMLDLTQPAFGGATPGPRVVWVRWQDDSGNWSVPAVSTVWYGMAAPDDTDLPTVSGIRAVGIVPGSQVSAGGRVPIRTAWIGTDGMTFVRTYDYSVNSDVDPPTAEATGHDVATAGADVYLPTQRRHRLTVRAVDSVGHVGPFAVGPYFRTTRYDETSSAITYRGTWAIGTSSTYWLGKAKASSSRGATATLSVTARSIALVSVRAPTRGGAIDLRQRRQGRDHRPVLGHRAAPRDRLVAGLDDLGASDRRGPHRGDTRPTARRHRRVRHSLLSVRGTILTAPHRAGRRPPTSSSRRSHQNSTPVATTHAVVS